VSANRDVGGRGRRFRQLGAGPPILAVGLRRRPLADLYHFLLSARWATLVALIVAGYLGVNALFALGYLALGDGIENARPGSFWDAFFFSVQTMATVGYGKMFPRSFAANVIATVEVLAGGLGLAVTTGLVFSKFARPTARVLFSEVAVVTEYDGVPSLLFRMANARTAQIVEAHVTAMLLRTERTAEGAEVRRMIDLALVRDRSGVFALTWTAVHRIDERSPLRGEDPASLAAEDAQILVSLTGFDERLAQTVHARHTYMADAIRFGVRFADILGRVDGRRAIDYRKFHEVEAADATPHSTERPIR
jgi:inward rectifier potassium channel